MRRHRPLSYYQTSASKLKDHLSMSILPPKPDTNRHCFRPCYPGTFCACLGKMIPTNSMTDELRDPAPQDLAPTPTPDQPTESPSYAESQEATLSDLQDWAFNLITSNPTPDVTIGDPNDPYLLRWFVIPRNPFAKIYLHRFLSDDEDRAFHDHPSDNTSVLIEGAYLEYTPVGTFFRQAGQTFSRKATDAHRVALLNEASLQAARALTHPDPAIPLGPEALRHIELNQRSLLPKIPATTLFITGPLLRQWGFHCPNGWVHWKDFISVSAGGKGQFCD